MIKRRIFLLMFLLIIWNFCSAQENKSDSLKKIIELAPNDTAKVDLLLALSKSYFSTDPTAAIFYAEKAKTLGEKLNYQKGIGYALKNIGLVYWFQSNHEKAHFYFQQSLKIFQDIHFIKGEANLFQNIGNIYYDQGQDEKALEYYLNALKGGEAINDSLRIAEVTGNIAAIYGKKKATYDKAIENDMRALAINKKLGNDDAVGTIASNLGEVYLNMDDDTTALKWFEESLKAYNGSEDTPYALTNIGRVYRKRKDYDKAIEYQKQAFEFAKKLDSKLEMARALKFLAKSYYEKKDIKDALLTYTDAYKIAEEINAQEELKDIYEGLALCYSANHDFGNAFKYQSLFTAIKDTIYNIETGKKLNSLVFNYEIDKKQNEISLLTKDKEIQEQVIQKQRLVRNGFIGGFAIVLVFAGVFFTQRNRISKEKKRSDELLLNILPEETAEELKATGTAKAKSFDMVSVLFTDFKNFTQASEKLSPEELVEEINHCYSEFDKIITKHGIEKIKTIGDAYMCAGGLPVANKTHPYDAVAAGLEMVKFIEKNKQERIAINQPFFELRLGIHTGPVVAGIVGIKKFAYDIWGDTVNTASRMESSGEIGKVNVSGTTYELVKDKFKCVHRGKVKAKNKGEIDMYFVESKI
jgi:adenylate cyclase